MVNRRCHCVKCSPPEAVEVRLIVVIPQPPIPHSLELITHVGSNVTKER